MNNFGSLLRQARKDRGLSQRELAAKLGMDFTYLCKIESGSRFPNRFVPALANFLGIPQSELFQIIGSEKLTAQMERISEEPVLTLEQIEAIAARDRAAFFNLMGRDYFRFPRDKERIPKLLYGLQVVTDDELFSRDDRAIFAGLFPRGYSYQGMSNVIAIATKYVKDGRRRDTTDQTQTFQILHEMGHYKLHWPQREGGKIETQLTDRPLYCSSGDSSPREVQANHYAGAFLMPEGAVRQLIGDRKSFVMGRDGRHLCEHFFVEPWILKRRLRSLGIRVVD